MISPEQLRRYPFFSFMNPDQLREVAMITDEVTLEVGEILFNIDEKATACYLLMEGAIDLHYVVSDEYEPQRRKAFVVGSINPGELLGISALVEPYKYTATAIAINPSKLLKIDGEALHQLVVQDPNLGCGFQTMVAKATMERLHATRILLAAATTPS